MKPILIIPDCHVPFHDAKAWKLLLNTAIALRPEKTIILGDFMDNYSISSHQKSPKRRHLLLMDEVGAAESRLNELDAHVSGEKYFIQGNHEWRLDRYIAERAPELFGLTSTEKLLSLKDRGWRYVPYHSHIKIGKVYYTHDTGKAGINAHRLAERAFSDNAIIGHTHRMALEVVGNAKGHAHISGHFGWLGDIGAAEYMHLVNARRDWTLGFGTGWIKKDGTTFFQIHPIINHEVCVDGQIIGLSPAKAAVKVRS